MENKTLRHFLPLRWILGIFFLLAGLAKIWALSAQSGWLASFGMPLATVAIVIALIVEIVGGAALLWHKWMKEASLALFVYMILVMLIINLSLLSAPFANVGFMPSAAGLSLWNLLSNLVVAGALWGMYKAH